LVVLVGAEIIVMEEQLQASSVKPQEKAEACAIHLAA
jgi:hypothetical protein